MSLSRKPASLLGLAAAGALTLVAPPAHAANPVQVVMTNLNNPFGLTFGPDGGLYVADAGTGGPSTSPGFVDGNHTQVYFGDTGDVTEDLNGVQTPVITGLPSLGAPGGTEATGLTGITFAGGNLYGLFGLGADPAQLTTLVSQLPSGSNAGNLGQLVNLTTNTPVSNIASYETLANYTTDNPDFGPHNPGDNTIEANPYGLAALIGGGFAVTDGGGNVALGVAAGGGAPQLLSQFLPMPNLTFNPANPATGGPVYQAVPTGVAQDANGNLFVGEFTGYPFTPGSAGVYQVNQTTKTSTLLAGGFTNITGLTVGPNGDLYVLDDTTTGLAGPPSPGQLFQLDPTTGTKTFLTDLAPGSTYAGLVAGPDDALYLTSQGNGAPGAGQVLRYSLAVPEPSPFALLALGLLPVGLLAARKRRKA